MMDVQDEMTILYHEKTNFKGTYSREGLTDGSLKVDGWRQILIECRPEIGDRWISVLHHGHAGFFLFFKIVPKGEEYRASSYEG